MPAAYKGLNRRIKDSLVTIISGITYDPIGNGNAEPAFVSVLDNAKDDFEGYPAVTILPNNLASITGSNVQKDHTVSFGIFTHLPIEDPQNVESALFNQIYDLTDLIVDTLEHDDYIGKLSQLDPAIQSWRMDVKQARWYLGKGAAGALLIVNVDCDITYSKDVY